MFSTHGSRMRSHAGKAEPNELSISKYTDLKMKDKIKRTCMVSLIDGSTLLHVLLCSYMDVLA